MNAAGARTLSDSSLQVPASLWDTSSSAGHAVQFYEDNSFLLDRLGGFISSAIVAGNSAVVIAPKALRDGLSEHLRHRGLDITIAIAEKRFLLLDAAETLAEFMVDGLPEPKRFARVIGEIIVQLASAAQGEERRVAVFGQMVALLWEDGKSEAAIRLEQLWNQLAEKHPFQLYCAYPMNLFSREGDGAGIQEICAEHSHVIPAERYPTAASDQERFHAIVVLQQKARALETEIRERKKIQQAFHETEAELKDFLENAVIGMHWVAADGTILWANKAELALVGYEPDEYIGHHLSEFHPDGPVIEDILQHLSRNEELHDYESRLSCKDGSIRHVRIDSNVFMRNGEFVHTRCFITDITEKIQAEEALFRLAAIVESSDDAIVSKDLNGIISSWNDSAERMFGYKAAEIIGRPVTLLIPPELLDDEHHILAKIRAGERIDHFQTMRLTKSGDRIDVSLTVSPVKNQRGKIIGAAKILRDVTQQKKLEAALHTTERLASVGRLAATVAHEINNPLEAVTNFVYLARQQPDLSEDTRRYLSSADQELRRVAHITQQTLGFYRDNSQPGSFVLSEAIENVLTIYELRCRYKALHIERRIAPDLTVYALQGELKQILSNLIANAIDACREGGRIVIGARISQHHLSGHPGIRITIADNGVGISSKDKQNLFVPFFTTKKAVGTGLGLWITKDLLEKRGGHIRFRSSRCMPSGTVMSIYLPSVSPAPAAESLGDS